jgi:hypothetical protein
MSDDELKAAMALRPEGSSFGMWGGKLIAAHPERPPAIFEPESGWTEITAVPTGGITVFIPHQF